MAGAYLGKFTQQKTMFRNRSHQSLAQICRHVAQETQRSWVLHALAPPNHSNYKKKNKNKNKNKNNNYSRGGQHYQISTHTPKSPSQQQRPRPQPQPQRHAIVVPFRNRAHHLESFLEYMSPYLQYHYHRNPKMQHHSFALCTLSNKPTTNCLTEPC